MKNLVSAIAIISCLTATSAMAADLPSHKAPPAPPSLSWTGFYAGLNAGYTWGTNSNSNTSLASAGSWSAINQTSPGTELIGSGSLLSVSSVQSPLTQSGFIGGAQFGYNHQWNQNYVFGFETDIQGSNAYGSSNAAGGTAGSSSSVITTGGNTYSITGNTAAVNVVGLRAGLDYLGTARARIGYVVKPNLLIYGTAGLAYGGAWASVDVGGFANTGVSGGLFNTTSIPQTISGKGNASSLLVGYSAGGGVEWMFMPNWSLKFEGLYYNLGNMNVATAAGAGGGFSSAQYYGTPVYYNQQGYVGPSSISGTTRVNYQGVIARAGLNYHFAWDAPVVAKF